MGSPKVSFDRAPDQWVSWTENEDESGTADTEDLMRTADEVDANAARIAELRQDESAATADDMVNFDNLRY